MRKAALALCVASATTVLLAAGWLAGLRVNLTESIPRGVYRAVRSAESQGTVRRGETVLVCLPTEVAAFARARAYVPAGGPCPGGIMPAGKVILATAGDTVVVSAAGLTVNGQLVPESAPLTRDCAGRPLQRLPDGPYVAQPGELWLGSRSPRGFDSRYFGAIPIAGERARLSAVWVTRPRPAKHGASYNPCRDDPT